MNEDIVFNAARAAIQGLSERSETLILGFCGEGGGTPNFGAAFLRGGRFHVPI